MWPYPWTHVGTPSHLGHMDRVAATMPSQAHAGAAQEAPDIGQWEGQDVPLVRPSSCNVKGGIPSSRRYLPTYLRAGGREGTRAREGRAGARAGSPGAGGGARGGGRAGGPGRGGRGAGPAARAGGWKGAQGQGQGRRGPQGTGGTGHGSPKGRAGRREGGGEWGAPAAGRAAGEVHPPRHPTDAGAPHRPPPPPPPPPLLQHRP